MFPLFGILHRMLFWELLRVFLLSLTGLTSLFLLGGLIQQASQMGLSPNQILTIIPLLIPSTLPYTIPATTLFAACVVYGRMSADNEATAMKAAGIDLYTTLRPVLLLGILTSVITAGLYYSLIPRTQQQLQQRVLEDPEEVLYNIFQRERSFRPSNFPYAIFVRDVQGRRLIDVVFKQRAKVPRGDGSNKDQFTFGYDTVAMAREARLVVNLEKGTLSIDPDRWIVAGEFGGDSTILDTHGNRPIEIELPDMFSSHQVKARPMSLEWEELPIRIAEIKKDQADWIERRELNHQMIEETSDPEIRKHLVAQEPHFAAKIKELDRQIRTVQYEQHMRPALAFGCLCFAMIGCPVGIWANRSDYLSTFVICFLPVVLTYFPLLLAGGGLAKDGKVPMFVGIWLANFVVGMAALFLTVRLIRR